MFSSRQTVQKKKPVILFSTDSNIEIVTVKRRGNCKTENIKSVMLHAYIWTNLLYLNLDGRSTVKFQKKVVFNIFERMTLNWYIIYQHNSENKKLSRLEFTSSVICALEKKWIDGKIKLKLILCRSRVLACENCQDKILRRFVVCSGKDRSVVKRSNLICFMCKKGLHGVCVGKHVCK